MSIIKISKIVKIRLDRLKIHKSESYDSVIERLVISQDELDIQTIGNIRKSLTDIKRGKIYPLEKIAKELGL